MYSGPLEHHLPILLFPLCRQNTSAISDRLRGPCGVLLHFLRLLRFMRTPRGAWLPTQPSDSGVGPTPQPAPYSGSSDRLLRKKRIKHNKGSLAFSLLRAVGSLKQRQGSTTSLVPS